MGIRMDVSSVNNKWKEQVKKDPNLSKEEKRRIIMEAHKSVFIENLLEFLGTVFIAAIACGIFALIGWITSGR